MTAPGPLTLGTAGHIDHGKTQLVRALTGVDTDRLPEERARGISIALGYAPLALPSGRRLSLVDVPGHERFVRTMVAGATGIDLFLMVVAADDGVMPQTLEHATVLRALGVREGVVAVTKADLADPARAAGEAARLLPEVPVVACSARTGEGVADVAAALDAVAARVASRAGDDRPPVLHVDRAFTVPGRGVVVTGTLWSGALAHGDALELLPGATAVRVRGLQVHDAPVERAQAGQRVAVALGGVRLRDVARGDVLAAPGALRETTVLDAALDLDGARHGERVHVHHGTREAPGRLSDLGDGLWQLRLDRPLLAADGDRVVVRRSSPADTLGGGRVLDAAARRHGRRPDVLDRLAALRDGRQVHERACKLPGTRSSSIEVEGVPGTRHPRPLEEGALAVEARLREAGASLLREDELGEALGALREHGRAVRVAGRLYAHAEVLDELRARVVAMVERDGAVTLAGLRDELGTSRRSAQAVLEHLDAARVTRRLPDDRRVLRRSAER
ncbi:selenocysteine-specific translation elongation factor [Conexibacter sp. SYSU D00693]|uniref:selenocysteine-specific translation elongation factor n=1 Tax=Conexibacter sp. SYSU D00693 TaxID=2812560 RepID=UPI00196B617A|nr:selenocysteine-specific translation elongation factor [Conexibacter sp. SYSU D00693]